MKYFTKEWWGGGDDPSLASKAYWTYIATIRSMMPQGLARLLDEISLHDSKVESLTVKPEEGLVVLILNGSSDPWCRSKKSKKPDVPRRLTLRYSGVTEVTMRNGDGTTVTELDDSDLGYDEIEALPGGSFQHRMLFASGIELHLTFKGFHIDFKDEDAPNEASQDTSLRADPER